DVGFLPPGFPDQRRAPRGLRGGGARSRRRGRQDPRRPRRRPSRSLGGQQRPYFGAAVKALTAPHQDAGAAPETVEIDGREWAGERVANLAASHALAEADDPPVVGVRGDSSSLRIGARELLADVR